MIYDGQWNKGVRDGEGEGLIQTHANRGYVSFIKIELIKNNRYHGSWLTKNENEDIVVGKYRGCWKKGTLSGRGVLEIFNPPPSSRIPPNSPAISVTGKLGECK
jgi:hypothetical protein